MYQKNSGVSDPTCVLMIASPRAYETHTRLPKQFNVAKYLLGFIPQQISLALCGLQLTGNLYKDQTTTNRNKSSPII